MIHDIIGSGILVAVGAGLGGIGVALWRVQAYDQARRDYQRQSASLKSESAEADKWARSYREMKEKWAAAVDRNVDHLDAHSRLSDAHNSTKERIERALECETPGANATVKRMARILRGDA